MLVKKYRQKSNKPKIVKAINHIYFLFFFWKSGFYAF